MNLLGVAIAITAEVFRDKVDKGGHPYILHCLRVMNDVKHLGEAAMCVAVMHDVVEDTKYTINDIADLGFSEAVCYSLSNMTHRDGVSYEDYIKIIGTDPLATAIKLADLQDNSDITRLKGIRKKDLDRMEKYHKAYLYLKD